MKTDRKPIRGDVVTFSFQNYAKFVAPVNPTIEKIRTDLSWDDVVMNHFIETPQLNGIKQEGRRKGEKEKSEVRTTRNSLLQ